MVEPHVFSADETEWAREDRFPGIAFKIFETRNTHPAMSVAMARVDPGTWIQWHTHAIETETAFVLSGSGVIETDEREYPISAQTGMTIPPGIRHCVRNTGDVPLEILAMHTPPTR